MLSDGDQLPLRGALLPLAHLSTELSPAAIVQRGEVGIGQVGGAVMPLRVRESLEPLRRLCLGQGTYLHVRLRPASSPAERRQSMWARPPTAMAILARSWHSWQVPPKRQNGGYAAHQRVKCSPGDRHDGRGALYCR